MAVIPWPVVEVRTRLYWPATLASGVTAIAGGVTGGGAGDAFPPPHPPNVTAKLIKKTAAKFVFRLVGPMTASPVTSSTVDSPSTQTLTPNRFEAQWREDDL
jgi:hypothetical protein